MGGLRGEGASVLGARGAAVTGAGRRRGLPRRAVRGDVVTGAHGVALTVGEAASGAGGHPRDASAAAVYYRAPEKSLGGDGGLWRALVSPAAIERIEAIAASDRYIPESLSLKQALDNSRLQQTLNTPAIATPVLLAEQLGWMLEQGGLEIGRA